MRVTSTGARSLATNAAAAAVAAACSDVHISFYDSST
jgi:hypothetical protein